MSRRAREDLNKQAGLSFINGCDILLYVNFNLVTDLLFGFTVGFFVALALVILSLVGLAIWRRLISDSKSSLSNLVDSQIRLQNIVSELLARANEADQDLAYLSSKVDKKYTVRLSAICSKLVSLGDSLVDIEADIKSKNAAAARSKLSENVEAAKQLSTDLQIIRIEIQRNK